VGKECSVSWKKKECNFGKIRGELVLIIEFFLGGLPSLEGGGHL